MAEMLYQEQHCTGCVATTPTKTRLLDNQAHTDVDFFVPLEAHQLDQLYNSNNAVRAAQETFLTSFRHRILPIFNAFSRHVLGRGNLVPVRMVRATPYNFPGIWKILDMRFSQDIRSRSAQGVTFQFVILTSLPRDHTQPWDNHVVDHFDIDIVKNRVSVGDDLLPRVEFVDPGTQASLAAGSFIYTVPPQFTFQDSLKRLQKYVDRGFMLHRVQFREDMTTETEKAQWVDGFRCHVAHAAATRILRECLCGERERQKEHSDLLHKFSGSEDVGKLIQSFIA